MKFFEKFAKNVVLIFCISGKKETFFGINAIILDSMFMNTDWLYSVKAKREEFENEALRIIFIEIEAENDLGLD